MTTYLFEVQVGTFNEYPGDAPQGFNVQHTLQIFIDAENLSQANKIVEQKFGDFRQCRYKFIKEQRIG